VNVVEGYHLHGCDNFHCVLILLQDTVKP